MFILLTSYDSDPDAWTVSHGFPESDCCSESLVKTLPNIDYFLNLISQMHII